MAVEGSGCYLIDADGKQYFDGSSGAAVSCLGHGDADVAAAMKGQIDKLSFAHTGFFTSEPAEALADLLIANAPLGIDRVYFVSGGSEAVEAALKLARQYFVEIGESNRTHIIGRKQSYHGNTLGALAAGGNAWRREQFTPLLFSASHIDACYAYRGRADNESYFDYGQRMANELEGEILRLGPDKVMAFLAEPVIGATLGAQFSGISKDLLKRSLKLGAISVVFMLALGSAFAFSLAPFVPMDIKELLIRLPFFQKNKQFWGYLRTPDQLKLSARKAGLQTSSSEKDESVGKRKTLFLKLNEVVTAIIL